MDERVGFPDGSVKNLPTVQETRVQFLGWGNPLVKGMATHSSILAWRIAWTVEPGRLQSMGLQRFGHNWVTNTHTDTHTSTREYSFRHHLAVLSNARLPGEEKYRVPAPIVNPYPDCNLWWILTCFWKIIRNLNFNELCCKWELQRTKPFLITRNWIALRLNLHQDLKLSKH